METENHLEGLWNTQGEDDSGLDQGETGEMVRRGQIWMHFEGRTIFSKVF